MNSPRIPAMRDFKMRLRSFGEAWPHRATHFATPTLLAMSGFFHSPGGQHKDRCICYHCGVALVGWEEDDEPSTEHHLHSPNCPVIHGSSDELERFKRISKKTTSKDLKKETGLTIKRKQSRTVSNLPYFDRILEKRRRLSKIKKPTEQVLSSKFQSCAAIFLKKILLSTISKDASISTQCPG
ncbi:hypothetical protein AAMO2058_000884800 [Amorphochlora amoebiformis]